MKDIDGIGNAWETLKPHWVGIQEHFDRRNAYFLDLILSDRESLSMVLKSHLVIEVFLNEFLKNLYGFSKFEDLRLSFSQKAQMIPPNGMPASWLRPGILQLNRVRNKFGHTAGYKLDRYDITAIFEVLAVARQGVQFADPADAIEAFAAVACAFLDVPPEEHREIFAEAFSQIRTYEE